MNNLFCRSWFCLLTSSERHLQLFLLRLSNNAVVSGCCGFSAQVKLISCNCPSSLLPPRLLVSPVALVVFPCHAKQKSRKGGAGPPDRRLFRYQLVGVSLVCKFFLFLIPSSFISVVCPFTYRSAYLCTPYFWDVFVPFL